MNIFFRAVLFSSFSAFFATVVSAATLTESGDFPDSPPGANFLLEAGSNTVSGSLTTGNGDSPDFINVQVPAGFRLVSATGTMTVGNTQPPNGTPPIARVIIFSSPFSNDTIFTDGVQASLSQAYGEGSYDLQARASVGVNIAWSVTFVVEELPDYEITRNGSSLTIRDLEGNGDTLTLGTASGNAAQIEFSAPGRTFSVDGGSNVSGSSGGVSLSGVTSVTINAEGGADTINVGSLPSDFPRLSINAGAGDDLVQFSGAINFSDSSDLVVTLTSEGDFVAGDRIIVGAGAALTTQGDGDITLRCDRNIVINGGAMITSVDGFIRIEANIEGESRSGSFSGINISGSGTRIQSVGSANIMLRGRGGDGMNTGDVAGFQLGVNMAGGAQVIGGLSGSVVTVEGTGGPSVSNVNRGITLSSVDTKITSIGGDVSVTGRAGVNGSRFGVGVALFEETEITAGGGGEVNVTGIGTGAAGSGGNFGIELTQQNARITSGGGNIVITAIDELNENRALRIVEGAFIRTPSTSGGIQIAATGLEFDETTQIETSSSRSGITILPANELSEMGIGTSNQSGRLDLKDAEIDRISTSNLTFENQVGGIILQGELSPENASTVTMLTGGSGYFSQSPSGGTVTLSSGVFLIEGNFRQNISDSAAFSPLLVNGNLDISNAELQIFSTWVPDAPETVTLIENDATDPVNGTFFDAPEGGLIFYGDSLNQVAAISYLGGSGNDVTLSAIETQTVANNNDAGPGSLRQALVDAVSPALIDFDPSFFSGGEDNTITLNGQISIPNKVLVMDASSVGGVTLDANQTGRVISSSSGGDLTLNAFSITGGDTAGPGGGIENRGSVMYIRNCSIFGNNSGNAGGGIISIGAAIFSAENCSIYNNHADDFGGGVENNGNNSSMTLTNGTIVRNSSDGFGGGLTSNSSSTTIGNLLIAHNTAPSVPDQSGSVQVTGPILIRDNSGASSRFAVVGSPNDNGDYVGDETTPLEPLLVGDEGGRGTAAINNGGPTPTILPLPGSPAIGNGAFFDGVPLLDQRGEARFGQVDIGAVQPDWGELLTVVEPFGSNADLIDPSSLVEVFPPLPISESPVSEEASQAFDDVIATKYLNFVHINGGVDVTPQIGASSISGIRLTVPEENSFNRDPKTFLLLGSNDGWNYTPVLSGEVPEFVTRGVSVNFYRSIGSDPYRFFRLIFPNTRSDELTPQFPFIDAISLAEIELLGAPAESDVKILSISTTADGAGNYVTTFTYLSKPNYTYNLRLGPSPSSLLDSIPLQPSDNSFISTGSIMTSIPKAFFRIEEFLPVGAP